MTGELSGQPSSPTKASHSARRATWPRADRVSRDVDARADIYSLGAILYRLTSGVNPYKGETVMRPRSDGLPRRSCRSAPSSRCPRTSRGSSSSASRRSPSRVRRSRTSPALRRSVRVAHRRASSRSSPRWASTTSARDGHDPEPAEDGAAPRSRAEDDQRGHHHHPEERERPRPSRRPWSRCRDRQRHHVWCRGAITRAPAPRTRGLSRSASRWCSSSRSWAGWSSGSTPAARPAPSADPGFTVVVAPPPDDGEVIAGARARAGSPIRAGARPKTKPHPRPTPAPAPPRRRRSRSTRSEPERYRRRH